MVFLADTKCCAQSRDTIAKRPGWSKLSAVKNDQVIALDDAVASRWGPRVVDLAKQVGDAVRKAVAQLEGSFSPRLHRCPGAEGAPAGPGGVAGGRGRPAGGHARGSAG
ncbi:hypothetical protein ACFQX6_25355 [Streptosporangium lutulentum]